MCQTKVWGQFKPTAEYTRHYTVGKGRVPASRATAQIASFKTHKQAVAAAAAMARSLDCTHMTVQEGYVKKSLTTHRHSVVLKNGVRVYLLEGTYQSKFLRYSSVVEDVAVFATGTHVEIIHRDYTAQEFDVDHMVPLAKRVLPTLAR